MTKKHKHLHLPTLEEKGKIMLTKTERISKKDYLALKHSGYIPKAIPSMWVLVVKPDQDGHPHRAKSCIVVLGNHEDRYWEKSKSYAPVLKYDSLWLLTATAVRKSACFVREIAKMLFAMPNSPTTKSQLLRPPVGDPAAGTLDNGYLRSVPLPRVQLVSHMAVPNGTPQVPLIRVPRRHCPLPAALPLFT